MKPIRALAAAATLLACLLPFSRGAAAAPPSEASEFLGTTVVDARGKRLGALTDLGLDLGKDRIVGVQVGHSTSQGMANKRVASPAGQWGVTMIILRT